PCVRRPCRRVRAAVEVNHPVHRPPPLDVVRRKVPRYGVDFLLDSRSTHSAPLMRWGMRPALILRYAPNGFRCGLRPLPARSVERRNFRHPDRGMSLNAENARSQTAPTGAIIPNPMTSGDPTLQFFAN